jgi:prenyltransferase beta subunit
MRALSLTLSLVLAGSGFTHAAEPAARSDMEKAVDRALQFLSYHQDKREGCWRVGNGSNAAITGLSVMAFLSAGHVPGEGPYGETVTKGVEWVLSRQQTNGLIASVGGQEMYHHGICTLMMAEVIGMTDGKLAEDVRKKLEKAVALILQTQRKSGPNRGGWRYRPMDDGQADISVTGWQVLALRAAKNVGCDVPPERIDQAVDYIKRCQNQRSGGFGYLPGGSPNAARTGTGILCLEICGKQLHHSPEVLQAGDYLINQPVGARETAVFYSIYYCSQAMFQLGGNYWNSYRGKLHDYLLRSQNSNGSWSDTRNLERGTGPNYGTAMAVLALTVEYRYLPIYQRAEEPAEKGGR